MTTINNNEKVRIKNKETVYGIDSTIKRIIEEDDVDTLLSMIQNGLDINTFSYKNLKGINAFILYKYENNKENVGNVINMLLLKYNAMEDLTKESFKRLDELSYNEFKKTFEKEFTVEKFLEGFGRFIADLSGEIEENQEDNIEEDIKEEKVKVNTKTSSEITNKESNYSKNTPNNIPKDSSKKEVKKSSPIVPIDNEKETKSSNVDSFDIIGDANYKVSSISAYVTLENEETCDNKQISIQVSSLEELSSAINKEIEKANNENNEKLASSVVEMMSNNPEFKKNLLSLMREAQISKPC